jgi:hypothetical protein
MNIIAHRGFWKNIEEMNSKNAFSRAIKNNYGIETDVRDYLGEVVISHDIPNGRNIITFDEFICNYLSDCSYYSVNTTLAINIKSDGLQDKIYNILKKYRINNYFLFDMSIPDSFGYLKLNLNVYYRISEYEIISNSVDNIQGVWLDQFQDNWYKPITIQKILEKWGSVCIVSPELHHRQYNECWSIVNNLQNKENIMLCTDFPDKAKEFFNG